MSRPVKNDRTSTTPGGPKIPNPKGKIGKPEHFADKANPHAGTYLSKGKAMFLGKDQILKDNRRS